MVVLELVVIPMSDVDKAKPFYGTASGWPHDADFSPGDGARVIQLTAAGSQCSIISGNGITAATASVDSPPAPTAGVREWGPGSVRPPPVTHERRA